MKFLADKKIMIILFMVAILLVSIVAVFYYNVKKVKSSSDQAAHSQEVLRISNDVLLDIMSIETGLRGYILTENEIFLEPYNKLLKKVTQNLSDLALLCAGNRDQQSRVDTLKIIVGIRLTFITESYKALETDKYNEIDKIETIEHGKTLLY